MKTSTWLLALAALLLFAGCASAVAEQAQATQPKPAPKTETAKAEEEADGDGKPIPPEFEPPFPGNQNFFTPPQVDIASTSGLAKNADGSPEVRLLGFVKIEGGSDRAIVQIGPLTDIIEPGSVVQGVEVISLQEPSITLQFNGARWNVNMFDAPKSAEPAAHGRGPTRGPAHLNSSTTRTPPTMGFPGLPPLPKFNAGPQPPSFPNVPPPPVPPM